MKVLLVSEEITRRPAEGLLVFLMHLSRYLAAKHDVTVIYRTGDPLPGIESRRILSGKLNMGAKAVSFLKKNRFDCAVYLPSSSMTGFGLLRGALLRHACRCPLIMIALQQRNIGAMHRYVSLVRPPDMVLSPVADMREHLERIGLITEFIMPGFDDSVFKPARPSVKARLRSKYGLQPGKFIVLHVGHVKENRNLQVFLRYREWGGDIIPLIKGGEVDNSWRDRLRHAGIIVMDQYTDDVHELYQASDLYVFPVSSRRGALEFPLSVIEAAACGLPVVTTRFGSLPEMIKEGDGILYFDSISQIPDAIRSLRGSPADTARKVERFSWKNIFDRYLEPHMQRLAESRRERS